MQCRYGQIQNDAASALCVYVILYIMHCKHVIRLIRVYVCVEVYSDFETSTLHGFDLHECSA